MLESFNANNDKKLKPVDGRLVAVKGANFGVQRGAYGLRDMVDQALALMIDNGDIERIIAKHNVEYLAPARGYQR